MITWKVIVGVTDQNLSDVQVTSIADGDFIVYDSSQQLWLNTDTIDGGTY